MDQQQTTGLSQENRILRLTFPNQDGPKKPLFANTLDAYEGLSQDFRFVVEAISEDASIQLKEVMGKLITIELVRADGSVRYFNGHVFEFRHTRSDGGFAFYDIALLPWLAFLHVRTNNYLFHDKTTRQALEKIFGDYAGKKVEFRVPSGKTHTFRAQWCETDHNYVHRRLEEEGLYYWYEHSASGHTLIISDDSQQAPLIDGDRPDVTYALNATGEEQDSIVSWVPVRQIASGKVSLTSFDFKQPKPMEVSRDTRNNQGQVADYEIYEYTGEFGFVDKAQGEAIAKRHMEEIEGRGKHFEFAGNCRWLQPGRWFLLAGHYDLDQEEEFQRRFLISEVRHSARNNYLQKGELPQYTNTGSVQRKYIPFRPGRGYNSEQPRIYGIQSAIVVGPAGEEIHCDKYGRVRVQFHWDREGQYDDKSSCWIRVASTWAGSRFGAMSIPRIGQEVLVQWLDGNPDLPIITGRVFNEMQMPPWDLPANQTQTGILTRSSKGGRYDNANAIRFEDKMGEEQLWLHAEKNQLTEVEHDEDKWVGNDRRKTIDRDETNHIQRDRTETVDRDETITVHGKRTEVVDGNEDITIHSNRSERVDHNETIDIGDNRRRTVGDNESVDIGSNQSITVGSSKTETVTIAKALTVGAGYAITVGGAMNTAVGLMQTEEVGLNKSIMVGKTFSITAGDELSITVGEAKLLMKKDGTIELTGTKIKVAASPGPTDIFGTNVNLNPPLKS